MNTCKDGAEKDFHTVKRFLSACGFTINEEKSIGEAKNSIEYLGLLINSLEMSLSLLPTKVDEISRLCSTAADNSYDMIPHTASSLVELNWWKENIFYSNGRKIENLKPDLIISSDASLVSWGLSATEPLLMVNGRSNLDPYI